MNERYRPLTCCLALAILAAFSSDATALARHKQMQHAKKAHAASKRAISATPRSRRASMEGQACGACRGGAA